MRGRVTLLTLCVHRDIERCHSGISLEAGKRGGQWVTSEMMMLCEAKVMVADAS